MWVFSNADYFGVPWVDSYADSEFEAPQRYTMIFNGYRHMPPTPNLTYKVKVKFVFQYV